MNEYGWGMRSGEVPVYWLIVRNGTFSDAVMVDISESQKALAVFSFEEEAEMFAGTLGRGWYVREFSSDSLLAVLHDSYRNTRRIALDPLPAPFGASIVALLSVSREYFAYHLLSQSWQETGGHTSTYQAS